MSAARVIKKGEFLIREGDKITNLYLLQSGSISVCLTRGKKNFDMIQVGPGSIVGEIAFSNIQQYPYSAIATVESKVLDIPMTALQGQIDASPQSVKLLVKSLADRLKVAVGEMKTNRLEKDSTPCPDDQVAKVFGSILFSILFKGESDTKTGVISMDWPTLRSTTQRIFGETSKRIESAIQLLTKIKLIDSIFGKPDDDPEGADELKEIKTKNIEALRNFVEFYQYYYFKGGKADLLKVDESDIWLLEYFVIQGAKEPVDRFGAVTFEYTKFIEHSKEELGYAINKDHFFRLESKGLYAKRKTGDKGDTTLQYEFKEFQYRLEAWKILRELSKWNEKGFIDFDDIDVKLKKKSAGGPSCAVCSAELIDGAKFCSQCGAKAAA